MNITIDEPSEKGALLPFFRKSAHPLRLHRFSCSSGAATASCSRGFALLLTLGLLALITSVLVALTALATRETALQSQQMALKLARENARLALFEALAALQTQAGTDNAITARAQMLGDASSSTGGAAAHAQAWTGVWRADAESVAPVWLVSGEAEPTRALAEVEGVALVAARYAAGADAEFATPAWEAVRVPLVSLPGGGYAWWVGDEGVKVNVGAPKANRALAQAWLRQSFAEPELERLATLLPGPSVNTVLPQSQVAVVAASGGQERVIGRALAAAQEPDDAADAELRSRIFDIMALGQLAEHRPEAARGYRSDLFHEITFGSHGVMADPQTGLRADYSQAPERFPLGGAFALYADYAQAMEPLETLQSERRAFVPTQADLRRRYRMRAPAAATSSVATPAAGEVSAAIAPVLTDCYMVFNVHKVGDKDIGNLEPDDPNYPAAAQRNRVMIHAGLVVELWNPYTSALVPQDLLLEVEGLPEYVRMHPVGAATLQVPLAASLRNGAANSKSWWIELPFTDKEHPGKEPSWFPGRVYNWTGPNNYMSSSNSLSGMGASVGNFLHRDLNQSAWAQLTAVNYPASAPDFRVELPAPTSLTLRLWLKPQSPSQWASAPILAEIRDVRFERMPASAPLKAQTLVYQFGFRVRLEDPGAVSGGSMAAWNKAAVLRRADPRTTAYTGSALGVGSPTAANSYYIPSRNPQDYVQSTGKGFFGSNDYAELWNRQMGPSGLLQVEDAPLFELPRHALLRVADLRHLHLVGTRPYAIGNRWGAQVGGDVNRVFDLGFFSGVSAVGGVPLLFGGDALPNERLLSVVEYPHLQRAGANAAAFLLLHGAFNINTRSELAWRAVLAGALYGDFDYIYSDPRDGTFDHRRPTRSLRMGRAVARYAQSAAETFDTGDYRLSKFLGAGGLHDPAVEPPSGYFRRGLVGLEPEHLDLLARNVSRRIGERANAGLPPFRSFAQFLGPQRLESFRHPLENGAYMSVLEAAVYDTMMDTSLPLAKRLNRDATGQLIWWDTPSFVTGGDLWAQFAHYAAVRSDTFRVRAYGRSDNSVGALQAEAWCEALVQRVPQLHGQALRVEDATQVRFANDGFGRKFRVVSLRWLRKDEL